MNSFLAVAEDLNVKGLTTEEQSKGSKTSLSSDALSSLKRPKSSLPSVSTPTKRRKPDNNGTSVSVKAEAEQISSESYEDFPVAGEDGGYGAQETGEYDDEEEEEYAGEIEGDPIAGTSTDVTKGRQLV